MASTWTAEVEFGDGQVTVVWTDGVWSASGTNLPCDPDLIAEFLEDRTETALVGTGAGVLPVDWEKILRTVVEDTFLRVGTITVAFEPDEEGGPDTVY